MAITPVNVGLVPNTNAPLPVSSVTADIRLALEGVAKNVAIPVPNPDTPVLIGRPVQLVNVPLVGVPNKGVTKVGEVAKTSAPDPVSFVTAAMRFALDGVAKNVAIPVPNPETPVLIGKPVQLVNVPLTGVPSAGVIKVGDVANTSAPDPVSSVTADIRFALDGVAKNVAIPVPNPETPVLIGRPVQLVNVPLLGVPRTGVTKDGDVLNTSNPVPDSSVTADIRFALEGVAKNVAIPAANPETPVLIGRPVQLVNVPLAGVPRTGVTKDGDVLNTNNPVPVSSVIADIRFALDGVAKNVAIPVPNPETPVLIGRPVQAVNVPLEGVPRAGVTNTGDVLNTNNPVPVSSVTADIRLALDGVAKNVAIPVPNPETPVLIGRPVQLVNVPLTGVPRAGVTKVGEVAKTSAPDPVSSVTAAARLVLEGVSKNVATPVPRLANGIY